MENDILDSLTDLGYEGPLTDEAAFSKALDGGHKSLEYTKLVHILAEELKTLCNLEETVNVMNDPDESSSFLLELSSFLKELGCPYKKLITGHMSSRLQTKEDRLLLLDYLISELMAARMVNVDCAKDKPSGAMEIVVQESPTAKDLKEILMSLKFNKPPPNITPEMLFSKLESKLKDTIQKEGDKLVGKPLYNKAMTEKEWKQLENCFTEMFEEYRLRRETLITRLECTIQSFEWSERLKSKKDVIQSTYRPKREQLKVKPAVRLSDFLAARTDLLTVEKTSSAAVRANTQSDVNKVIIGRVPDRGGRPNEQQPPPPEMPFWQQRSAPQVVHQLPCSPSASFLITPIPTPPAALNAPKKPVAAIIAPSTSSAASTAPKAHSDASITKIVSLNTPTLISAASIAPVSLLSTSVCAKSTKSQQKTNEPIDEHNITQAFLPSITIQSISSEKQPARKSKQKGQTKTKSSADVLNSTDKDDTKSKVDDNENATSANNISTPAFLPSITIASIPLEDRDEGYIPPKILKKVKEMNKKSSAVGSNTSRNNDKNSELILKKRTNIQLKEPASGDSNIPAVILTDIDDKKYSRYTSHLELNKESIKKDNIEQTEADTNSPMLVDNLESIDTETSMKDISKSTDDKTPVAEMATMGIKKYRGSRAGKQVQERLASKRKYPVSLTNIDPKRLKPNASSLIAESDHNHLDVVVMTNPFQLLTPEETSAIQVALEECLYKEIDGYVMMKKTKKHIPPPFKAPRFRANPEHVDGTLKLFCEDQITLEWLEKVVSHISPISQTKLVVKRLTNKTHKINASMRLPFFKMDREVSLKKRLAIQNPWYDLPNWFLKYNLSELELGEGLSIKLMIPPSDVLKLSERDFLLSYELESIYIHFNEDISGLVPVVPKHLSSVTDTVAFNQNPNISPVSDTSNHRKHDQYQKDTIDSNDTTQDLNLSPVSETSNHSMDDDEFKNTVPSPNTHPGPNLSPVSKTSNHILDDDEFKNTILSPNNQQDPNLSPVSETSNHSMDDDEFKNTVNSPNTNQDPHLSPVSETSNHSLDDDEFKNTILSPNTHQDPNLSPVSETSNHSMDDNEFKNTEPSPYTHQDLNLSPVSETSNHSKDVGESNETIAFANTYQDPHLSPVSQTSNHSESDDESRNSIASTGTYQHLNLTPISKLYKFDAVSNKTIESTKTSQKSKDNESLPKTIVWLTNDITGVTETCTQQDSSNKEPGGGRGGPRGGGRGGERGGGGRGGERGGGRGGDRGRGGRVQGGYNQSTGGGDQRQQTSPSPWSNGNQQQNQRNYQTYEVPAGGYNQGYSQNQGYNQNQGQSYGGYQGASNQGSYNKPYQSQGQGYQNQGYQNQGQQNQSYQNHGYQNRGGYQNEHDDRTQRGRGSYNRGGRR
ncbi:hypothetical protein O0L34_g18791 [Tuta absoluta]|nr:hypothetical protein O0L34_g18791 [Tuta absoluta]